MMRHVRQKLEDRGLWRIPELSVVLALLAVIGGFWLFAEVADEVIEDETRDVDHAILQALRSAEDPDDPWGPRWVEIAGEDITAMGSYAPMFVTVGAVAGFLLLSRRWGDLTLVLIAVGLGLLLNHFMKDMFNRGRPDVVPHLVEVHTLSFPSGHAMMSAVVYLTLGALLAQASGKWRIKVFVMGLAVLMTLLIGTSRVYLGVHYPSDVLAGWSVGLAWAALVWLVAWGLRTRSRLLEPQPLEDSTSPDEAPHDSPADA